MYIEMIGKITRYHLKMHQVHLKYSHMENRMVEYSEKNKLVVNRTYRKSDLFLLNSFQTFISIGENEASFLLLAIHSIYRECNIRKN